MKEFSDTFKEGQDFEFVKYKLSQVLEVNPEQIVNYNFYIIFKNRICITMENKSYQYIQSAILDLKPMIKSQ